ncbi:MAG: CRISPR-associated helicase Cas3' [Hyphomicrobiales bacterium]|nr:CRISPR-associated helicase Cas3' [Hyphomicrobiales bacterium]
MTHYAHSTPDPDRADWQILSEHLTAVADLAAGFAKPFGAERAARLAGLLHDLGKYNPDFQARLSGANIRVDHSTAGAATALALADDGSDFDRMVADLVAYAIAGHHAGLPDREGDSFATLTERLNGFGWGSLEPAWEGKIKPDATGLMPPLRVLQPGAEASKAELEVARARFPFQLAFLGRMIFSCLVDADYKDTEKFYTGIDGRQVDRVWPLLGDRLAQLRDRFDRHMASLQGAGKPVDALRGEVLRHVRSGATETPGLFTLTVPTGGGKTLASLGFALDHAAKHGHRRIIYAIPFTSIIDQTAAIFSRVLGPHIVLEHHSTIDEERIRLRSRDSDSERSGRDKLKRAMEDWAAPVVVTTNVQLFESLFAARTSRARKLHNIANSIIILDEAQMLPRPLLLPAVRALHELAENYSCTIVLCTATQPALDARKFQNGLPLEDRELAPDPDSLSKQLTRTRLEHKGDMDDAALVEALTPVPQGLVIVNSRGHALALYRAMAAADLDGVIHLTTRQYAAHRRKILETVRQRLANGQPCRLIATSLVECGVDLDFPRVWRAEAGLDQIAQAAGRCNREGSRPVDDSVVTVFKAPDHPPPAEIRGLTGDMQRMMDKHADLFSPAAIADFFGEVYWRFGPDGLDKKNILGDFSIGSGQTTFAYRTVAEKFRMIESGLVPVIVARDDTAREAVKRLGIEKIPSNALARDLQPFTIQVPPHARARLIDYGHVRFIEPDKRGDQFAVLVTDELYDPDVGLLWEDAEYLRQEQWMV